MGIRLWKVEWSLGSKRTVSALSIDDALKIARRNFPFKDEEIINVDLIAEEDDAEKEDGTK
jgi:hypothetical protein